MYPSGSGLCRWRRNVRLNCKDIGERRGAVKVIIKGGVFVLYRWATPALIV